MPGVWVTNGSERSVLPGVTTSVKRTLRCRCLENTRGKVHSPATALLDCLFFFYQRAQFTLITGSLSRGEENVLHPGPPFNQMTNSSSTLPVVGKNQKKSFLDSPSSFEMGIKPEYDSPTSKVTSGIFVPSTQNSVPVSNDLRFEEEGRLRLAYQQSSGCSISAPSYCRKGGRSCVYSIPWFGPPPSIPADAS